MVFLPIVERELRVASRSKNTHRIRLWTTFAGLLVAGFFILVRELFGGRMPNMGPMLFTLLTYYAFGLSLLAGVFLAADCISAEKREGTLGLLFLTDLKGYDVTLGKLMAVGLSALYGLVAVLPVTGLPLLLGGVTGGEYWRVSLALVNTLFFALTTGVLVSTWSREATRAMLNTIGLLLIMVVGLPMLGEIISVSRLPAQWLYLTAPSPFSAFSFGAETLYYSRPERYWICLASSQALGWFMLALASWLLPRAWQDKPFRRRMAAPIALGRRGATFAWPNALRARLLNINPILWLMGNSAGMLWWNWLIPLAGIGVVMSSLWVGGGVWALAGVSYVFIFLAFLLKVFMAFQACRFFVDARRSGALELILSTPLTGREIIRGQWLALRRLFLWPVILFISAQLAVSVLQAIASTQNFSTMTLKMSAGAARAGNNPVIGFLQGNQWPLIVMQSGMAFYQAVRVAADLLAVGWVGMWLGLSAKKPTLATPLTILFVVIIPSMVFCVPAAVVDVFFILWARQKLQSEFRRLAMPQFGTAFPVPAPPIVPGAMPPVIRL